MCVVLPHVSRVWHAADAAFLLTAFPSSLALPLSHSLATRALAQVRSIHVHYTSVEVAWPGGSAAFAIRPKAKTKAAADKKHKWCVRYIVLWAVIRW